MEIGSSDLLAQPAGQKRRAAPDRVAGSRFKDTPDERTGHLRRKDDGDALRGDAACAEPKEGAARRFLADGFGRFEVGEAAGARPPAVALHLAVGVHGQWRSRNSGVAGPVAAHKSP